MKRQDSQKLFGLSLSVTNYKEMSNSLNAARGLCKTAETLQLYSVVGIVNNTDCSKPTMIKKSLGQSELLIQDQEHGCLDIDSTCVADYVAVA